MCKERINREVNLLQLLKPTCSVPQHPRPHCAAGLEQSWVPGHGEVKPGLQ